VQGLPSIDFHPAQREKIQLAPASKLVESVHQQTQYKCPLSIYDAASTVVSIDACRATLVEFIRMKVLIACSPFTGHINPLFAIGRVLVAEGHEVVGLSARVMRERIECAGATFRPFPAGADRDFRDMAAAFPEYRDLAPGPDMSRFYLERVFIDTITAQLQGLKQALGEFPADVILTDDFLYGTIPMLIGPRRERPPIVVCGTMFLHYRRDDGAPNFAGLLPADSEAQRDAYASIAKLHEDVLYAPVRRRLNATLQGLGTAPLTMDPHEAIVALPEAYLQLTVPSFEFARANLPASVHFIGTLPIIPNQAPLPSWAPDLDGTRKVVLATQGTVSNHDFGQLIGPTLAALGDEPDILVVVTAGGRSIEAIPGPIPRNARLASYLPFEWLLPKVDALVTNGGYGSVNQALSFGIPLVTAGLSEDKADVNARVDWSGVGIDLRTQQPTASSLRGAVHAVLDTPDYRFRASSIAAEFAKIDTRSRILQILAEAAANEA
jgi:MGT family glycosyltransferase